jgi:hypothetical protein
MKLTEIIQQQKRILYCPINKCNFTFVPDITSKQENKNDLVYLYHCKPKESGEDLFEENKMGIAGLEIKEKLALSAPFEATCYTFKDETRLIFVKSSARELIEYLEREGCVLSSFQPIDLPW